MRFDAFSLDLHNKSIGHLLRPHRIIFGPSPFFLEKKSTIYLLYFVYIFESYLLS